MNWGVNEKAEQTDRNNQKRFRCLLSELSHIPCWSRDLLWHRIWRQCLPHLIIPILIVIKGFSVAVVFLMTFSGLNSSLCLFVQFFIYLCIFEILFCPTDALSLHIHKVLFKSISYTELKPKKQTHSGAQRVAVSVNNTLACWAEGSLWVRSYTEQLSRIQQWSYCYCTLIFWPTSYYTTPGSHLLPN